MTEKTAAEIAAEELEAKKLRGDFLDDDDNDDGGSDASADGESSGDQLAADESDTDDEGDGEDAAGEADGREDGSDTDGGDDKRSVAAESEDESIQIPKARFDEANRKAREKLQALQTQLDAANARLETKVESEDIDALRKEITTLEDKYEDHLVEGEVKEARAVRKELREKQEALTEARLKQQSQQTGASTIQQIRFDTQLAAYELKYPVLNVDSDAFDQGVADEVTDLIAAFQGRGLTPVAALNKAVHYVLRDAEPTDKADPDAERQKRAAKARRTVKKVKDQSPPDTKGAGRDSDKSGLRDGLPDISKMSIEAFEKLSEADLKALRGDRFTEEA